MFVASFALIALALPQGTGAPAVQPMHVTVHNAAGAARTALVTMPVPIARGQLRTGPQNDCVTVTVDDGGGARRQPARVAMRWPDDSVCLLHVHTRLRLPGLSKVEAEVAVVLGDGGIALPWQVQPHRTLLPATLPLHSELTDPWGRVLRAELQPDPAAGPDGVLWDDGVMRVRRFFALHRLPGGEPLLGLRAYLVTGDGDRGAELTLLLDNCDLPGAALGPVRFHEWSLVVTDDRLAVLPAFARENALQPPAPRPGGGFRQALLGGLGGVYLGDQTAKTVRCHLFWDDDQSGDDERDGARWAAYRPAAFPALDPVRETGAFGVHGGPAPRDGDDAGAAGPLWAEWHQAVVFGPFSGNGDPADAGSNGTPRNGDCMLHNVLRWQSWQLLQIAEAQVLQQTLRPTPGPQRELPGELEPYRAGIGPIARFAPHGFVPIDYEHCSALLLFDWYWLTGDALARDELARLGRGLRAVLPVQPFRTSRGEGWCLQSGALIARATGDRVLATWLADHAEQVVAPLLGPPERGVAIAQPPVPGVLGGESFDAPWQMAALARGLEAVHAVEPRPGIAAAVVRVAHAMATGGWVEGQGPKYFVSAGDPGQYFVAGDPETSRGTARMLIGAFALAAGLTDDVDLDALFSSRIGFLLADELPADARPVRRQSAAANPWLQIVLDRQTRNQ